MSLSLRVTIFALLFGLSVSVVDGSVWRNDAAMRSDILSFTDRSMEGLHPGLAGLDSAAARIAASFEKAGLRPAFGDTSWFQSVVSYTRVRAQGTNGLRDGGRSYRVLADWTPAGFSAEGKVDQVPLFFGGFGLDLPSEGLEDYSGIDPTGSVLLVLDEAPLEGRWRDGAMRRQKAIWARDHGAVGILFVQPRGGIGSPSDPLGRIDLDDAFIDCRILAGMALQAMADSLLSGSRYKIDRPPAGEEGSIRTGPVGEVRIDWVVSLRRQKQTLRNVAGIAPGSRPGWILVQAPYQGRGGPPDPEVPTWLPCANDVASGLSTLLELARRNGAAGTHEGRSLVFAATVLTEQGQKGAAAVATAFAITDQPIVAVVTLERLGRLEGGAHAAAGPDPEIWKHLLAGRTPPSEIDLPPSRIGDALPLGKGGIPFLYIRGENDPAAATEADRPDRLDVGGMMRVAALLDAVLHDLADPALFP